MTMLPVKRNPYTWLPTLLNDFLGDRWLDNTALKMPAINIRECENCYTVEVAAPGLKKEDLKVYIDDGNRLTISVNAGSSSEDEAPLHEPCEEKSAPCSEEGKNKCEEDKSATCEAETSTPHKKEGRGRYLRREFSYAQFRQTLLMPENIDRDQIVAKAQDGILTITLPKKLTGAMRVAKQIDVE